MNKKLFTAILAAAIFATGCGSAGKNTASVAPSAGASSASYDTGAYETTAAQEIAMAAGETGIAADASAAQEQKIIISAFIHMSTEGFDDVNTAMRSITEQSGGYVQSSDMYTNYKNDGTEYRNLRIVLRVPSESYSYVSEQIKGLGVVSNSSETQENATQQYYDLQSRLKTKRIEEERLLELIGKATKVEDILQLEEMLGNVRVEIEVFESKLNNIDRLSSYSTIEVSLTEVASEKEVIVPDNLGGKMKLSFVKSLNAAISFFESLAVFAAAISVPVAIVITAAVIIWLLLRLMRPKKKEDSHE